jgi:hypothetical protein
MDMQIDWKLNSVVKYPRMFTNTWNTTLHGFYLLSVPFLTYFKDFNDFIEYYMSVTVILHWVCNDLGTVIVPEDD